VAARTLKGMARVRSGQASAWPFLLAGVPVEVSRVKRDFACAFTRHFPLVIVALRSQSRLRMEGRARTLSGPSPELVPGHGPGAFRLDVWPRNPSLPVLHFPMYRYWIYREAGA
jgi:hypothetical protein